MNKQFAKLKVYELGGGVAFQTETSSIPFLVVPKGQATMKPWGVSGFVFENVITGDVIGFVDTFDDILDSAGVVYGVSQIAVMTAVSAFFFDVAAAAGYPIDYPSGYYINFNHVGATTGANFVAPNFYYGAIQEVLTEVEITAPRIRIPGGAVGNGIVALYRFDGTQWVLVDQTAPFNTNVVGVTVLAWSTGNLILQPGVYCWCTNTSAGNSFETITGPLCSYFGYPNTMNSEELSLQLHPSAYTGVALATMPLALSAAGFVPNILNIIV